MASRPRRWTADDLWELPGKEKIEMVDGCPLGPKAMERRLGFFRRSMIEFRFVQRFATDPVAQLGFFGPGFGFVSPSGRGLHPPDLAFLRYDRMPDEADWDGLSLVAPDVAIEVLSLVDEPERMATEIADYLAGGVRLLWVVDPESRTITVHTPDEPGRVVGVGDKLDGGEVVPGLRIPVAAIFA